MTVEPTTGMVAWTFDIDVGSVGTKILKGLPRLYVGPTATIPSKPMKKSTFMTSSLVIQQSVFAGVTSRWIVYSSFVVSCPTLSQSRTRPVNMAPPPKELSRSRTPVIVPPDRYPCISVNFFPSVSLFLSVIIRGSVLHRPLLLWSMVPTYEIHLNYQIKYVIELRQPW